MSNYKKTILIILSVIIAIMSTIFIGCGESTPEKPGGDEKEEEQSGYLNNSEWFKDEYFIPSFRIAITADTHFGQGTTDSYPWTQQRLPKVFSSSYDYATSHSKYDKLDGIYVAGDFVDHGLQEEYRNYIECVEKNLPDGVDFYTVMAGHELISGTIDDYKSNMRFDMSYHRVINGFHVIAVGNDNSHAPVAGFDWLENAVEEAYNDNPYNPIFVIQHHPINNTIYGSDNLASDKYDAIYKKYPNIILFTAHTHAVSSDRRNVYQENYSMLGISSIAYTRMMPWINEIDKHTDVNSDNYDITEQIDDSGEYLIVESDEYGRTRVLLYDVILDDFVKDGTTGEKFMYVFGNVTDKTKFTYTKEWREQSKASEFDADANLKVTKSGSTYTIEFPRAKGEMGVFCYEMRLTKGDVTDMYRIESKAWSSYGESESFSYRFSGLTAGEYKLEVVPVTSLGKHGKALTQTIVVE